MNEQRSLVSGRKSCFLKTQNDLYYSLLFPFVNRENSSVAGKREERRGGDEKRKTSFSLI